MQLVQGFAFRMYSLPGCPHCEATAKLFEERKVPLQEIVADRLLEQGIIKSLKTEKFEAPVVINYLTGEMCVGENLGVYHDWITLYHRLFRSQSDHSPLAGSDTAKQIEAAASV